MLEACCKRRARPQPVGIEVGKGDGETRDSNAGSDGHLDDLPPGLLPLSHLLAKVGVHQQVVQVQVALIGLLDIVQEACPNDAATLQHASHQAMLDALGTTVSRSLLGAKTMASSSPILPVEMPGQAQQSGLLAGAFATMVCEDQVPWIQLEKADDWRQEHYELSPHALKTAACLVHSEDLEVKPEPSGSPIEHFFI